MASVCEWCERPVFIGGVCCDRCDEEAGAHTPGCDAAKQVRDVLFNRSSGDIRGEIRW